MDKNPKLQVLNACVTWDPGKSWKSF